LFKNSKDGVCHFPDWQKRKRKKIFWRKFQTFVNLQKFEFRAKLLFFLLGFGQSGKWQTSSFEFLNNALAPIFWHRAGNHKNVL
jgi:hypothetical protein